VEEMVPPAVKSYEWQNKTTEHQQHSLTHKINNT